MSLLDDETIAALSTPAGVSAIAVIRVSGDKAFDAVSKIFSGKIVKGRVNHGKIKLGKGIYDDVLILFFKKPNSYTGEDLIEIHTHGNMLIVEKVLDYLFSVGIRSALPGEFTRRAFLNGKIDLLQAEALENLIVSSTEEGLKVSFSYLEGSLSRKIDEIRVDIVELLSQLEANIDFPDYEVDVDWKKFDKIISNINRWTKKILQASRFSDALLKGENIIVAGKANVGKSSLLNAIVQEERALVSEYPGTTRDFLRERIVYRGKAFNLIDIAGIEETEKRYLEKKGIERALKLVEENEKILFVLDASQELDDRDFSVYEKIRGKKIIAVLNKIDKERKLSKKSVKSSFKDVMEVVEISAKFEKNIDRLLEIMYIMFSGRIEKADELALTRRQKELFMEMKEEAEKVIRKRKEGFGEEILAEHIRKMAEIAGKLTGKIHTEDVLDKIFSSFCIGK